MIVALRLGYVNATSLDKLLADASENSGRVVWQFLNHPVLCSFSHGRAQRDSLMSSSHVNRMFSYLALRAGVVTELRLHDLLRGAARDLIELPRSLLNDLVRAALILGDAWRLRVEAELNRFAVFNVDYGDLMPDEDAQTKIRT